MEDEGSELEIRICDAPCGVSFAHEIRNNVRRPWELPKVICTIVIGVDPDPSGTQA